MRREERKAAVLTPHELRGKEEMSSFESLKSLADPYAGGFKEIYSLENIDVSTIRKVGSREKEEPQESREEVKAPLPSLKSPKVFKPQKQISPSLASVEGDLYSKGGISPFVLGEPISSLRLSLQANQVLKGYTLRSLEDLMQLLERRSELSIPLGLIEEISAKLKGFLEDYSLKPTQQIHLASFLRALTAEVDNKRAKLCLQAYGLGDFIHLSSLEETTLRHLAKELREDYALEASLALRSESTKSYLRRKFEEVFSEFFLAFVVEHSFVISNSELEERLAWHLDEKEASAPLLSFLRDIFPDLESLIYPSLINLGDSLYCLGEARALDYRAVIEQAKTYFSRPDMHFLLRDFVLLLQKEQMRNWSTRDENFIKRSLQLSGQFLLFYKEGAVCIRML